MFKNTNIAHEILLAVLLLCTAYLVYLIIVNPLGKHDIILALAVIAGDRHWMVTSFFETIASTNDNALKSLC